MRILVTGGAGYVGSHTVVALAEAGHDVVVVDDLSTGNPAAVSRAEVLTGRRIPLHPVDVADIDALERIFDTEPVDAVVHLAARRPVGSREHGPLDYYETNLGATFTLMRCMVWYGVTRLVAASSAAVYGADAQVPSAEQLAPGPLSPFGRAAVMTERVLADVALAQQGLRVGVLRCFTPAGAHPSGCIGEHPARTGSLLGALGQVALGLRTRLDVHGGDHPTPDGTPMRDYVHVDDVAGAFVAALGALDEVDRPFSVWNTGSGRPASVLEVLAAFESVTGRQIPYRFADAGEGTVPVAYADPALAEDELGWRPARPLRQVCADHWRWQLRNPSGYPGMIGTERPWRGGVGHRLRLTSSVATSFGA